MLLTNTLNGLTAVAVGLILSLTNWYKNTENLDLRRKLARRQAILQSRYNQLEVLATRDSLTGLHNRKEFMRLADLELSRAARYGFPVGAIDAVAVVEGVARRRALLMRGGQPDFEKASIAFLQDYRDGKLGRISLETPESRRAMLSAVVEPVKPE